MAKIFSKWGFFKKDTPQKPLDLLDIGTVSARNEIVLWRDRNMLRAQRVLHAKIRYLFEEIDPILEQMTLFDIAKGGKRFTDKEIAPILDHWSLECSELVLSKAKAELEKMGHQFSAFMPQRQILEITNDHLGKAEIAKSIAATATLSSSVPLAISSATVSAGGIAGFFGATAISIPIAAVGAGLIGILLVTTGRQVMGVKERFVKKRKTALRECIRNAVLNQGSQHSICSSLQQSIRQAGAEIVEKIKNGS